MHFKKQKNKHKWCVPYAVSVFSLCIDLLQFHSIYMLLNKTVYSRTFFSLPYLSIYLFVPLSAQSVDRQDSWCETKPTPVSSYAIYPSIHSSIHLCSCNDLLPGTFQTPPIDIPFKISWDRGQTKTIWFSSLADMLLGLFDEGCFHL